MSPPSTKEREFATWLRNLVDTERREVLAALRRGLGKPPGTAAEMYPYMVKWTEGEHSGWEEERYYLVAALFAAHQISWRPGEPVNGATNLGASFARLRQATGSQSMDLRFVALLNCHRDDLPEQLRHAVDLLKSKDIPIDWAQLLCDLRQWERDDRAVQREWAQAFWREVPHEESEEEQRATEDTAPVAGT
jgi:CRISPR system Cascade subunit CasB